MTQFLKPPSLPEPDFADALVSRYFGAIVLSGGNRGGHMEKPLTVAGFNIVARLEIDDPGRVMAHELAHLDLAFDSFDRMDALAREAMLSGLRRAGSASSQLFDVWAPDRRDRDTPSARRDFVEALIPVSMTARVDGVRLNEERMRVEYVLPSQREDGRLAILFVDGIGPELAPFLRR